MRRPGTRARPRSRPTEAPGHKPGVEVLDIRKDRCPDDVARLLDLRCGSAVLIRERRYPVAGTITMDQLLVDVGDDPVEPGYEVVLFGRQGDAEIRAEEVAERIGTIGYEIVCAVSERVPREYRGAT